MNFTNKDIDILLKALFPIDNFQKKAPETQSIINQIFINLLTKELYTNNLKRAATIYEIAQELDTRKNNYYFGIQLLYFKSLISYLNKGKSEDLGKINDTIKIISYMGDHEAVEKMQEEIKIFLQNKPVNIRIGNYPMIMFKNN